MLAALAMMRNRHHGTARAIALVMVPYVLGTERLKRLPGRAEALATANAAMMNVAEIDIAEFGVAPILRPIGRHDARHIRPFGFVSVCGTDQHVAKTVPEKSRWIGIDDHAVRIGKETTEARGERE